MKSLAEELRTLRTLKDSAEESGRIKKADDAAFKQQQGVALQRMEIDEAESFRTTGYLYSVVEKVKGQVEDRAKYVRWALENDESILEFLDSLLISGDYRLAVEERFFDAIMSTSVVAYKEQQNIMNQQANAHVDDEAPLPPGLTFRPDPYISMTKS